MKQASPLATTQFSAPLVPKTSAQHRIASCVVAFLFAVSTFAVEAQTPPASNAVAASIPAKMLLTTHPLNGRIWDARDKKWVTEAALQKVLRNQRYVLLGETHDNHDHHKRHLQVLKWLATEGEKPALVMEQFDVENQSAMNDAIARGKTAATDFLALADNIAETGKLNKRGWQWPQYRPLVEATVARNAALVAANLSRADARNVYAKGFGAIPAYALPVALAPGLFDTTWNDARQAAVIATMVASHCGHLPAERAPGMVHAQRARDAVMANAMQRQKKNGAVLIAGRGHVRRDVGVPLYLTQLDSGARMLAIGFVEVSEGKKSPEDYPELTGVDTAIAPFDYVWFSARQDRPDPCAGLSVGNLGGASALAPAPLVPTATPLQK